MVLDLTHNNIKDISSLSFLKKLQRLYMKDQNTENNLGGKIADLTSLTELYALEELDLSWNKLNDISPLKDLRDLRELNLCNTQISDISALAPLNRLSMLQLCHNHISDVSALAYLENLDILDLEYNLIADLTPVLEIKNLTYLKLHRGDLDESEVEFLREKLGGKVLSISTDTKKSFSVND